MKKIFVLILLLTLGKSAFCADYKIEAIRYYNLGLEKNRVGAYLAAIDYFKEAVEIQPDFYDAYYNLAVISDYLGKTNEAIMYLNAVLKYAPEDSAAFYKLAQIYYKNGDFVKSKEYIDKIPKNAAEYNKATELGNKINVANKEKQKNGKDEIAAKTVPVAKKLGGINSPSGIVVDARGNVYVASFSDNAIFKLMPNGIHQLYSKSNMLNGPVGLAVDENDNLYVANYNSNNILKINKYGEVSIFVKYSEKPYCLFVKNHVLYVSEQGDNKVLIHKLN